MDYRAAMRLAQAAAHLGSDDLETHTGCVVLDDQGNVVAVGWNRLTPGVVALDERRMRPEKYKWIVHAERHAIITARKDLRGHTMVLPWFPCVDCAQAIVLAGIARLVCHAPDYMNDRWGADFRRADEILYEGGVELVLFNEELK